MKIIYTILILALSLSLLFCGGSTDEEEAAPPPVKKTGGFPASGLIIAGVTLLPECNVPFNP